MRVSHCKIGGNHNCRLPDVLGIEGILSIGVKPIYLYTILHPLVDACSVTVLVVGGMAWQRVLAYNALAFALQFPLGLFAGMKLAGGMANAAGLGFALAGAAVTWAGKAAGGYIGDHFGRWTVTAVSVVGLLSLCFLCRPEHVTLWLALLFVAQLATDPVLSLMYDKSGRASGTAFGLNCLALFAGSL